MSMAETVQTHLGAFEDALVAEFRAYQALVSLTREERLVLVRADLSQLSDVLARQEQLLNEIAALDTARETALRGWARLSGQTLPEGTLSEALQLMEPETAERLGRLRAGILALADELRELTRGNRALAQAALEHVDEVRNFLIELVQPVENYQPRGTTASKPQSLVAEHWA